MHSIHVRSAKPDDCADWLRMRAALWPEGSASEHAGEIERYFDRTLTNPLEVLLAVDEAGEVIGFGRAVDPQLRGRLRNRQGRVSRRLVRRSGVAQTGSRKGADRRCRSVGARAGLHGVWIRRATRQRDERGRSSGAGVSGDGADSLFQEVAWMKSGPTSNFHFELPTSNFPTSDFKRQTSS